MSTTKESGEQHKTLEYYLDEIHKSRQIANNTTRKFALVFHGGAGTIDKNSSTPLKYLKALEKILKKSYILCKEGINNNSEPLDMAVEIVRLFENHPYFNAGRGSVYTKSCTHELEASLMDGKTLKCGSVGLLKNIKNPILLARHVMYNTSHICLMGNDAEIFAKNNNFEIVDNHYFDTKRRYEQWEKAQQVSLTTSATSTTTTTTFRDHDISIKETLSIQKEEEKQINDNNDNNDKGQFETVGCVVMINGNIAAATSTGGLTNKMAGRIGDTPIIGAGTYANNNTGAFSGTGTGEEFMKNCSSFDCHARMLYKNLDIQNAIKTHVHDRFKPGTGGLIGVDKFGNIGIYFNSSGMYRGYITSDGLSRVGVWEQEIDVNINE